MQLVVQEGSLIDDVSLHVPYVLDPDEFPIVVGRDPLAHIRLKDWTVSRTHCEIRNHKGEIVVRDLDSRNGTRVNGVHVNSHVLVPGDVISVGFAKLLVENVRR